MSGFGRAVVGFHRAGEGPVTAADLSAAVAAVDLTGGGTIDGDLVMAAGRQILADYGTDALPGYAFNGAPGDGITGRYAGAVNRPGFSRSGTNHFNLSASGLMARTLLEAELSGLYTSAALRVATEAIKTTDYTAAASDAIILLNDGGGAALALTLPAIPNAFQMLWVKNLGTSALTVAGNGKNIDGAASLNVAAGGQAHLVYHLTDTAWYRIGA